MYKAGLIKIWGRSDEKWISENFLKKHVFCNFVILRARTVKLLGCVIIEAYILYLSTKLTISNQMWVIWVIESVEIMECFRYLPALTKSRRSCRTCPPLTCSNSHCSYNSIIVDEVIITWCHTEHISDIHLMMSFWPLEHIPNIHLMMPFWPLEHIPDIHLIM